MEEARGVGRGVAEEVGDGRGREPRLQRGPRTGLGRRGLEVEGGGLAADGGESVAGDSNEPQGRGGVGRVGVGKVFLPGGEAVSVGVGEFGRVEIVGQAMGGEPRGGDVVGGDEPH